MRAITLVLATLTVTACDSSTTPPSMTTGDMASPPITTASCQQRCTAKEVSCGVSATNAASDCAMICTLSLTQTQITCLEGTPCNNPQAAAACVTGGMMTTTCKGSGTSPFGAQCTIDSQCCSSNCTGGTCQTNSYGAKCTIDSHCTSMNCTLGQCQNNFATSPCTIDSQCTSNNCTGGKCQL
jgi:hypothetical protein